MKSYWSIASRRRETENHTGKWLSWWNGAFTCISRICIAILPTLFRIDESNKDVGSSLMSWLDADTSLGVQVQRRNIFFTFVEPNNSKPSRKATRSELSWCVAVDCLIDQRMQVASWVIKCTIRLFAVVSLSSVLNYFKKETAMMNSLLGFFFLRTCLACLSLRVIVVFTTWWWTPGELPESPDHRKGPDTSYAEQLSYYFRQKSDQRETVRRSC